MSGPGEMTLDATLATQSDRAVPDRHDEPAPDPVAGQLVGRYLVLSRLGAGAMGVVLSAYDSELDRRVAVKLLRGHRRGVQADARLQREAQALARLNHPNVVAVHDVGTHEGRVFLAMEFVEGQTLGAWMREGQGPRPWREGLRARPLPHLAARGRMRSGRRHDFGGMERRRSPTRAEGDP